MRMISNRLYLSATRLSIRHQKFLSTVSKPSPYRIAIVGSGPSAFYAAKYLLAQHADTHVDIYEKLPFPFGLVRYGVAPDHPEVKSVINTFHEVAKQYGPQDTQADAKGNSRDNSYDNGARFRFFGNIEVSDDPHIDSLSLDLLAKHYSAVLFAFGASADHALNLPNEDSQGILSARQFVNWYNGHPDFQSLPAVVDLSKVCNVVIVGHGNVAIDCARILAKHPSELQTTDITADSLRVLQQCNVHKITVIGRRGHVQSSFTIKELRELSKLPSAALAIRSDEIAAGWTDASKEEARLTASKKRILQLMDTIASTSLHPSATPVQPAEKVIEIRFLLNPIEILTTVDEHGVQKVSGLKVQRTQLTGEPFKQRAVATGEAEVLQCDLLLKSIGYKSLSIGHALPFDAKRSIVQNTAGRVAGQRGWYVAGWLKRGPSGIIGTNIADAKETVQCILEDIRDEVLPVMVEDPLDRIKQADAAAASYIASNRISWRQYERLNAIEMHRGSSADPPKPREKIVDTKEAISLAQLDAL